MGENKGCCLVSEGLSVWTMRTQVYSTELQGIAQSLQEWKPQASRVWINPQERFLIRRCIPQDMGCTLFCMLRALHAHAWCEQGENTGTQRLDSQLHEIIQRESPLGWEFEPDQQILYMADGWNLRECFRIQMTEPIGGNWPGNRYLKHTYTHYDSSDSTGRGSMKWISGADTF